MRSLGALSLLTVACVTLWARCVSLVRTANAAPFLGAQEESQYTMAIFLGTAAVILSLVLAERARRLGQIWAHTRVPATPERWSMVPPVAKPSPHPIAEGPARATDLLTAPLSGQPCVAYEIGVRTDAQVHGPWGSWIILEQHHAPDLTIGSWMMRGCAVHLDLDREPAQSRAIDSDRARTYFRERGLPSTIGYRIFETILRPGQTAAVHDAHHPTKQAAVLRSTA